MNTRQVSAPPHGSWCLSVSGKVSLTPLKLVFSLNLPFGAPSALVPPTTGRNPTRSAILTNHAELVRVVFLVDHREPHFALDGFPGRPDGCAG